MVSNVSSLALGHKDIPLYTNYYEYKDDPDFPDLAEIFGDQKYEMKIFLRQECNAMRSKYVS